MWTLQVDSQSDDPLTFRLSADGTKTLGRAPGADFVLDAALVSRLHCQFASSADGILTVQDLGSTNGTYVNGEKVDAATGLAVGDRVRVGRVELIVSRGSGD